MDRQTDRSFLTSYREHYCDYKCNNGTSKYAQHLLENKHSIGPIHNTMEILHVMRKGKLMDTWEKFHIHQETKLGLQINDKNKVTQNIMFDTVIQKDIPSTPQLSLPSATANPISHDPTFRRSVCTSEHWIHQITVSQLNFFHINTPINLPLTLTPPHPTSENI